MAFWIFKCSPAEYRLSARLAHPMRRISWRVNQHREEMSPGDTAFIWETGPHRGIKAIMRLETAPQMLAELESEQPYNISPDAGIRLRVLGSLTDRALYLSHITLRNEAGLLNLSVFRKDVIQRGTNFEVTPVEGAILLQLAGTADIPASAEDSIEAQILLPEEIAEPIRYSEGACRRVWVNAYERNREARRICLEHYGLKCCICNYDFGERYGAEFFGIIHVHHLRPLSELTGEYLVNPIEDLRPVCPNCHAVLHHGGQLRSIEDVRRLLAR